MPEAPAANEEPQKQDAKTDLKVEAQLKRDLEASGEKAPSDITKALIEDSDGSEPIGNGFFGKYLKKHSDLKKAAQAKIAQQEKEEKERREEMKRQLSEKIKADPPVF